jgi:flavin-dependent dehydrogenase
MGGDETDLLVIGGGPAGLATAIRGRLAGLDTLVIDGAHPPIDRPCGEGLMPDGVQRLRQLGVEIPSDVRAVFRGIRYLDGGMVATGDFDGDHGYGLRRVELHRALSRRAEELGVRLGWGVRALALRPDGVECDTGVMRARWMVAADGRSSRMRSWAGLDGRLPRLKRFGVRRHFELEPWSEYVEVHWSDDAEAYVTPVGPRTVGVAMLWSGGAASFDSLLQAFPALAHRLEGSREVSRARGAGPFGHRARAVVRDNLALVGDASCCLDPITGEGVAVAFHQAFAVVSAIERGDLGLYAGAHRRILRAPLLLARLLLLAEQRPWLRRRVVRALTANTSLFGDLLSLRVGGELPPVLGRAGILWLALRLARHGA